MTKKRTPKQWSWPPGDQHFPQNWRGYQKAQRDRFQYLAELVWNSKDEPPYMPPKKYNILIDIGAHAGSWCLDLADRYDYIIAYEPLHWVTLAENAQYLGVDHIQICPRALSNQRSRRRMYQRLDNSGDSGLDLEDDHPRLVRDIETITLDEDLDQIKLFIQMRDIAWVITSIKIDVQGHELEVLQGAEQTIREHTPTLCLELNDGRPDVEELLKTWGYELGERHKKDWIWRPTIPD